MAMFSTWFLKPCGWSLAYCCAMVAGVASVGLVLCFGFNIQRLIPLLVTMCSQRRILVVDAGFIYPWETYYLRL